MKTLDLSVYSESRTAFMGLAALMIVFAHASSVGFENCSLLTKLLWFGNYGVEFFLFASGIGIYYSISSDPFSLSLWYKKRYTRLFVPFLLITISFYVIQVYIEGAFCLKDFLLHITTLDFYLYHRGAWFIAMLLPLYLIAPILVLLLTQVRYSWLHMVTLSIASIILSMIFFSSPIMNNVQFFLSRIPVFFLGIVMAPYVKDGKKINFIWLVIASIISIMFWLLLHVQCMGSIALIALWGMIYKPLLNSNFIIKCLTFMGKISLESYLTNIYMGNIIMCKIIDNQCVNCRWGVFASYSFGNRISFWV